MKKQKYKYLASPSQKKRQSGAKLTILKERGSLYYSALRGHEKNLTFKKRMIILSRKDRLSPAKPTAGRVAILIVALFALMMAVNVKITYQHRMQSVIQNAKNPNEIQLTFVGDVNLGRYVGLYGDRVGYSEIFAQSQKLWHNSDYVFANLECVILDNQDAIPNSNKQILFPASKEALAAAYAAGIDAVSIANNHAVDFGGEGIASELKAMQELGMEYFGGGQNREEAATCKYFETDGIRIAFLGVTTITPEGTFADDYTVSSFRHTDFFRNIHEASLDADLVVVYAHWGEEYGLKPSEIQNTVAHQLIESGADIVIGSHPHILQNIERYRDGIIFYSLGNYIFDQGNRETRNSVMVQMNIDKTTGDGELVLIPIRIDDFSPHATQNKFYTRSIQNTLLKNLAKQSYSITDDERIHIPFSIDLMKGTAST